MFSPIALARRLYDAFARFDAAALSELLSNDFIGTVSDGMPYGVGGVHRGPADMIERVWARIATVYDIRLQPTQFLGVDDSRVVVLGRYRGTARDGGSSVDAAFAHVITTRGNHITALEQITDTRSWQRPPQK